MKRIQPVVVSSAEPRLSRPSTPNMAAPNDSSQVERVLERAFAPLHKRALGVAFGLTVGLVVFSLTVFHIVAQPADVPIHLLAQYFYGYDTSWRGAFIGMWWGFIAGFAAGWFLAFLRNFLIATWIVFVRAKASLAQTRDFLDHI
jgi:hypothetical protein